MPDIDIDAPGTTLLLMGNEAIARGALEAGIGFAASYPGTPSSEILPTIVDAAPKRGIYAEWSTNEIVAIEAATAASLAGIRAMSSMKQNGTQVALDFLGNLAQRGVGAGLVLVTVDDPGSHNSSNEQDTRHVSKWLDIPMLEPGDFQEAKDMTKWLFDLSEEVDIICMLRAVSKISHTRGNVKLGELSKRKYKASFPYVSNRPRMFGNPHDVLHKKLALAKEKYETSPFNKYVGPDKPELLIITSGATWLYSQEAVRTLGLEKRVGILKLGTIWPLPEKLIIENLDKSLEVLFVEEIDPFVEGNVMELAASQAHGKPQHTFYGKRSGHINAYGELGPDDVIKALTKIMGITYQVRDPAYLKKIEAVPREYTFNRGGALCPGCPHRASFWNIRTALKLDGRGGFATGDIGCYTQGLLPGGFSVVKTLYCMGGSAGLATGFGKLGQFGFNQPVLAVCGDSTFFHATIPALINGVFNDSNYTLVVLDNTATAMTGFQPHPGTGRTAMGEPARAIRIEDVCRSFGVPVEVCDPFNFKETTDTLLKMMAMDKGVRVVVMKRECELIRGRREEAPYKVTVDPEICLGEDCGCDRLCTRIFLCPGLRWNKETGKSEIDPVLCTGCGVCVDVCPQGAIKKEAR
jgi:indolepyruvate ferredoxin oxidoreductase, alpha subunit